MIDIELLRKDPELVKTSAKNRGMDIDVDYVLEVDEKRRKLIQEVDELRAEHNKVSDEIAKLSGDLRAKAIEASKEAKDRIDHKEFELKAVEVELEELMYKIPNILLPDVPLGKSEEENVVIREVGKKKIIQNPKDYIALGEELGLIDTERAAKVSGSRFAYLKGEAALLEFALIQLVMKTLTSEETLAGVIKKAGLNLSTKPFLPVVPPVMIKPDVFKKMARLSDADKDERYHLPQDDLYLVGSAEHTLGAMHMDEIIAESDLPLRYIGFSTSFRREAGSYGKDTRGIIRVHQFDKLEMESFAKKEDSLDEQNLFIAIQERLMQELGIPYRVVFICTGDMGTPDARQIDIEAWMPGQGKYRETHTADLMTDYQTRRLKTRVRRDGGEVEYVHTNDATAFAIGRTIVAILENYQNADGSVAIPEALQQYFPADQALISRK